MALIVSFRISVIFCRMISQLKLSATRHSEHLHSSISGNGWSLQLPKRTNSKLSGGTFLSYLYNYNTTTSCWECSRFACIWLTENLALSDWPLLSRIPPANLWRSTNHVWSYCNICSMYCNYFNSRIRTHKRKRKLACMHWCSRTIHESWVTRERNDRACMLENTRGVYSLQCVYISKIALHQSNLIQTMTKLSSHWREEISFAASLLNGTTTKFYMEIHHTFRYMHKQFRGAVGKIVHGNGNIQMVIKNYQSNQYCTTELATQRFHLNALLLYLAKEG